MVKTVDERIQSWLDGPFDLKTKEELQELLQTNPESLRDAFFKDLSFGTGGMRGIMGIGTNRMNVYTVRMASQGLANYLKNQAGNEPAVFIGYDVRHQSRLFAEETAKVMAGNGIKALLSKEICPVPLVSFACRYFKCSAAVMITASHNPPEYNGYKVYWSDGCQIVPPHDEAIMLEVKKISSPADVLLGATYEEIDSSLDDAYLAELRGLQRLKAEPLKIVYTNLHGTGIRLIPKALKSWGYTDLNLVEKQSSLDPNFTNAPSPNPEEEKALELGIEELKKEGADILIATDPDADRIGLATAETRFSGNQIACLCLYHICKTLHQKGTFPENGAFVKSIVTTELFRKIGEDFGGKCIDVLTGFKYIGELIGIWERAFDGYQFLFGAEESYGYLFHTFVRDKDAISSACLIAEMASAFKKERKTLEDALKELYQTYGIHRESLSNFMFSDSQEGTDQMNLLMKTLRESPPEEFGGQKIVLIEDFLLGVENLPQSDVVRFWLGDSSKIVIRPSGTEPKIKFYAEAVGKDGETVVHVDARLKKLSEAFAKIAFP